MKDKLEDTWSPQQISAWLRTEHPDRPEWHVCHETIYQALYHGGPRGLSRQYTAKLRTGRPLRKRRRRSDEQQTGDASRLTLLEGATRTQDLRINR